MLSGVQNKYNCMCKGKFVDTRAVGESQTNMNHQKSFSNFAFTTFRTVTIVFNWNTTSSCKCLKNNQVTVIVFKISDKMKKNERRIFETSNLGLLISFAFVLCLWSVRFFCPINIPLCSVWTACIVSYTWMHKIYLDISTWVYIFLGLMCF